MSGSELLITNLDSGWISCKPSHPGMIERSGRQPQVILNQYHIEQSITKPRVALSQMLPGQVRRSFLFIYFFFKRPLLVLLLLRGGRSLGFLWPEVPRRIISVLPFFIWMLRCSEMFALGCGHRGHMLGLISVACTAIRQCMRGLDRADTLGESKSAFGIYLSNLQDEIACLPT